MTTTTYITSFRDISIDSVPSHLFSGVATWVWDETWNEFFITKLELYSVFGAGSIVNLRRRNKDQGLNLIFSEIEDALMDDAQIRYETPTQHYFHEALG